MKIDKDLDNLVQAYTRVFIKENEDVELGPKPEDIEELDQVLKDTSEDVSDDVIDDVKGYIASAGIDGDRIRVDGNKIHFPDRDAMYTLTITKYKDEN